jgi:hypothetical protein
VGSATLIGAAPGEAKQYDIEGDATVSVSAGRRGADGAGADAAGACPAGVFAAAAVPVTAAAAAVVSVFAVAPGATELETLGWLPVLSVVDWDVGAGLFDGNSSGVTTMTIASSTTISRLRLSIREGWPEPGFIWYATMFRVDSA